MRPSASIVRSPRGDLEARCGRKCSERHHPVRSRIGMRQAASDGAAAADGAVGDAARDLTHGMPQPAGSTPSSISACVTAAPISTPSPLRLTARSTRRCDATSTTCAGRASSQVEHWTEGLASAHRPWPCRRLGQQPRSASSSVDGRVYIKFRGLH